MVPTGYTAAAAAFFIAARTAYRADAARTTFSVHSHFTATATATANAASHARTKRHEPSGYGTSSSFDIWFRFYPATGRPPQHFFRPFIFCLFFVVVLSLSLFNLLFRLRFFFDIRFLSSILRLHLARGRNFLLSIFFLRPDLVYR